MTWQQRVSLVKVGDRVCYSKAFVRSTGQMTGDVPFARGKVTALEPLSDITLAAIEWDCPDCAPKVNVKNLSRVTERGIMERD